MGALDRGYLLDWPLPGLLALRGGKLTLALSAARQALRAIDARAGRLGLTRCRPRPEDRLPTLPPSLPASSPTSLPSSLPEGAAGAVGATSRRAA
jgi:hypothetical protein